MRLWAFTVVACLLARDAICQVRHSRCRWISRRAPIAFASGFETPMSIMSPPTGFASRQRKTACQRILAVDFEDGNRDHQVAGKLEGVGLCEREIIRHLKAPLGAGQIRLDGS
ncbi:Hypothetical protein AT6N2_L0887 [Agrobacterium tumefaciens]|nr:Hypothetical protein AT6N2_L0887 [Agrobacterium tumefaciens]